MSDQRQNHPYWLALELGPGGEASGDAAKGTETLRAERATESPAGNQQMMEAVCERENLREALQRVKTNKGSPGIDGMTVEQLPEYLKQHWPTVREQLLSGTYLAAAAGKTGGDSEAGRRGAKAWHPHGPRELHLIAICIWDGRRSAIRSIRFAASASKF